MSVNDYNLKVISQDKRNVGSIFRTFNIDGDDIIGVEEHEPFELRFENNTYNAVQIRLSIDGTDVLTGKPASTKPKGDMFLVEPRGAMRLKAWPENMSGGARFVFATTEKSVAVNTHGNTAGIGLIAAAVYTDYGSYDYGGSATRGGIVTSGGGRFLGGSRRVGSDSKALMGRSKRSYNASGSSGATKSAQTFDMFSLSARDDDDDNDNLAVGAGEYTDQHLVKKAGLRRPVLDEIIQLRYLPWAKLQQMLGRIVVASPNAFPGDKEPGIDLSNVPRTRSTGSSIRETFYRFYQ